MSSDGMNGGVARLGIACRHLGYALMSLHRGKFCSAADEFLFAWPLIEERVDEELRARRAG